MVFLEISQKSQENTCVRVSFLIKLQTCNFIKKEAMAYVFYCEFCEISKNAFLHRTPLVAASALGNCLATVSDDMHLFITGQCSLYITSEYIKENKGFMVILGGIERKNGPAMG